MFVSLVNTATQNYAYIYFCLISSQKTVTEQVVTNLNAMEAPLDTVFSPTRTSQDRHYTPQERRVQERHNITTFHILAIKGLFQNTQICFNVFFNNTFKLPNLSGDNIPTCTGKHEWRVQLQANITNHSHGGYIHNLCVLFTYKLAFKMWFETHLLL